MTDRAPLSPLEIDAPRYHSLGDDRDAHHSQPVDSLKMMGGDPSARGSVNNQPAAHDLYEEEDVEDRRHSGTRGSGTRRSRVSVHSDGNVSDEDYPSPGISYPTPVSGANTSMKLTVLLLINNVVGGGVLSLANAFKQTSPVGGVILLLFTTFVTSMNLIYIVDAAQEADEYRIGVLTTNTLPTWASHIVLISLILWPGGTCAAYAQIVSQALPPVLKSFDISDDNFVTSHTCWLLIGCAIFFSISWMRNLSDLLLPSIAGLVAIVFSGLAIVIRFFDGSYAAGGKFAIEANYTTPSSDYEVFYVDSKLFMALPVFAFALNTHSNAPKYFEDLRLGRDGQRSSRKMLKAFLYSHLVIMSLYLCFGLFGYFTFGPERLADNHGDILNSYSNNDTLMNVVRIFYFIVICVSFPILCLACRRGFNQWWFGPVELSLKVLIFETFVIICLSGVVATFVPSLDVLLAILGSLVGTVVMFVAPSAMYIILCTKEGEWTMKKAMAYFSIIYGIAVPGILGLVITFQNLDG